MATHVAGTTPYPWPYDGDLDPAATALVVVAPAGFAASDEDAAAGNVALLAAAVRDAGGAVLAVTTTAMRAGRAVPAGPALPSAPALVGARPDVDLVAGGVDAFYGSDLELVLSTRHTRRLLLVGAGLETAVHSTMRDANDRGYECLLVVDACVPVDPSLVGSAVSQVEMSGGIFGAVGRTADVLAALAAPAPHPPTPLEGALR